jgi:hypothetical protein
MPPVRAAKVAVGDDLLAPCVFLLVEFLPPEFDVFSVEQKNIEKARSSSHHLTAMTTQGRLKTSWGSLPPTSKRSC